MHPRPFAARALALGALLVPASAWAQSHLNAGPSTTRTVEWSVLGLAQVLVVGALAYLLFANFTRTDGSARVKGLAAAAGALALGIATLVMVATEPVVMKPFISADTRDLLETLGGGELALAVACGLLVQFAPMLLGEFVRPEAERISGAPPPVEPARRSGRGPRNPAP
jgi:hypothetical protein